MSRVQLALNVADLDASIEFYTKLFKTPPAKVRENYANFAIAEPPLKLVLIAGAGRARFAEPRRCRGGVDRRGRRRGSRMEAEGAACNVRRVDQLLLRRAGQGLGDRSGDPVGDLHRARRRRRAARRRRHAELRRTQSAGGGHRRKPLPALRAGADRRCPSTTPPAPRRCRRRCGARRTSHRASGRSTLHDEQRDEIAASARTALRSGLSPGRS